jgi:hypothetical protein
MNLPYGLIMVTTNETACTYLNPNHKHRIDVSLLAGSIAGAAAASITKQGYQYKI